MAKVWAVLVIVTSVPPGGPGDRVGDADRDPRLPGGRQRLRRRRRRRLVAPAALPDAPGRAGPRPAPSTAARGLILGALWLSLGLGPGLAGAQERSPAQTGGVYRRPLAHDPATLDPARLRDIYSLAVGQQLFDGLVQFDQTLSIMPALAQFWVASRDGLTWTFTLRKGVKFHHGREVTADDVVYSFTRLLDPRVRSGVRGPLPVRAGGAGVPGREGRRQ